MTDEKQQKNRNGEQNEVLAPLHPDMWAPPTWGFRDPEPAAGPVDRKPIILCSSSQELDETSEKKNNFFKKLFQRKSVDGSRSRLPSLPDETLMRPLLSGGARHSG